MVTTGLWFVEQRDGCGERKLARNRKIIFYNQRRKVMKKRDRKIQELEGKT